ncbi:MAG TPA: PAS domain-containing protein, partial [Myxococcaceae bacterium]|nr:PAS domain-containing protein [Myxococcaceae bacterium]
SGWAESVHPEDFQHCLDDYFSAFVLRREFRMEYRLRRADGQYRWILDTGRPRNTPDGRFSGYIGSCIDVTDFREINDSLCKLKQELEQRVQERTAELMHSNRELRRSEARLAEAEAVAHVGSWEWDIDEDKVWWSEELHRMMGLARSDFGASYRAVLGRVHPDDRQQVEAVVAQALRDQRPYMHEFRIIRPDGEIRVLHSRGQVRVDKQKLVFKLLGVAQDVTEQRNAEQIRIRLVEEKLAHQAADNARWRASFLAEASKLLGESLDNQKTLFDLAQLAVVRFADWCAIQLLEKGEAEAREIARAYNQVKIAESDLKQFEQHLSPGHGTVKVVLTGSSEFLPDVPALLAAEAAAQLPPLNAVPDLSIRSAMVVPIAAREGIFGAMIFALTESVRKYNAGDLALAEELGRRVGSAMENARLYQQAQEAIHARDEFMSIASHELRTPLSALVLQLSDLQRILQQERAEKVQDKITKKVNNAMKATSRLSKLVESLLDVSRIATGRLQLQMEELDLAEVAQEVVERHADAARRAGCDLRLRAPQRVPGKWDRVRLEQILTNLISNALKYGEGKPVEVAVEGGDDAATLSIKDHGIGISSEDLARIFGPFERAVSIRHYGGLGLGLYVARQIVQAHGGSIQVESAPSAGATFVVKLPGLKSFDHSERELAQEPRKEINASLAH